MMRDDFITTKAIVLKTSNLGEYDRRMVVLTSDYGKITVFARGVRRQGSRLMAATSPFTYGELKAFPGKNAYSLMDFSAENFFEGLRKDFEITCYAMYFIEVADYYSRENNDDVKLMQLLYVSLRYLDKFKSSLLSAEAVRAVFEIRAIYVNGEFPGIPDSLALSKDCAMLIGHITGCKINMLYGIALTDELERELLRAGEFYRRNFANAGFKSLNLL